MKNTNKMIMVVTMIAILAICSWAMVSEDSDDSDASVSKTVSASMTAGTHSAVYLDSISYDGSDAHRGIALYSGSCPSGVGLSTYQDTDTKMIKPTLSGTPASSGSYTFVVHFYIYVTTTASGYFYESYITVNLTVSGSVEITTVTVTYNATANGGTCSTVSSTIDTGDSILTLPTPAKPGYTFLGWYTAATGGTRITTSTTFSASAVIFAQFEEDLPTVYYLTVTFNANGGSGAPSVITVSSSNLVFTFTIPTTAPTKTDSDFDCWSPNVSGVSQHSLGESITVSYSNTSVQYNDYVLYAIWEDTAILYTVNYNANGGSGIPSQQNTESSTGSATFIIPSIIPVFADRTFLGWSANEDSTTAQYAVGSSVTVSRESNNILLFAVWSVNGGGGETTVTPIASFLYEINGLTVTFTETSVGDIGWDWSFDDTVTSTSQNPVHTYEEAGSYTVTLTITGSGSQTSTCSHIVKVGASSDVTYTITFDFGDDVTDTVDGKGLSYIILPDAAKVGYTFAGWYDDGVFVGNFGSEYQINGETTLTADYQEGTIERFTVEFNDKGTITNTQKVISGGVATHVEPTHRDVEFIGWYTESEEIYTFGVTVTEDLTLTAHYLENDNSSLLSMIFWIVIAIIVMCVIGGLIWILH